MEIPTAGAGLELRANSSECSVILSHIVQKVLKMGSNINSLTIVLYEQIDFYIFYIRDGISDDNSLQSPKFVRTQRSSQASSTR